MNAEEKKVLALLLALGEEDKRKAAAAYKKLYPGKEFSGYVDLEAAHIMADEALMLLLPAEIVEAFDAIAKWYA